jgi:hypothetical protein
MTGKKKLAYIGHSQGTTQIFCALSMNFGELREKLWAFVALVPVAVMGNSTSSLVRLGISYWKTI